MKPEYDFAKGKRGAVLTPQLEIARLNARYEEAMSALKASEAARGRLISALTLLVKDHDRGMESSEATWDYAQEAL